MTVVDYFIVSVYHDDTDINLCELQADFTESQADNILSEYSTWLIGDRSVEFRYTFATIILAVIKSHAHCPGVIAMVNDEGPITLFIVNGDFIGRYDYRMRNPVWFPAESKKLPDIVKQIAGICCDGYMTLNEHSLLSYNRYGGKIH